MSGAGDSPRPGNPFGRPRIVVDPTPGTAERAAIERAIDVRADAARVQRVVTPTAWQQAALADAARPMRQPGAGASWLQPRLPRVPARPSVAAAERAAAGPDALDAGASA